MKTLLAFTLLSCASLSASLENNAYVFIYESETQDLNACILYENHYYYAPKVEHYMKCPCVFSFEN
jgi:hypothetical protein